MEAKKIQAKSKTKVLIKDVDLEEVDWALEVDLEVKEEDLVGSWECATNATCLDIKYGNAMKGRPLLNMKGKEGFNWCKKMIMRA